MMKSMIAQTMSGFQDGLDQAGMMQHLFAHDKKYRPGIVAGQNIQNPRRYFGCGAIVESEVK